LRGGTVSNGIDDPLVTKWSARVRRSSPGRPAQHNREIDAARISRASGRSRAPKCRLLTNKAAGRRFFDPRERLR
jgi:hypothetical protein